MNRILSVAGSLLLAACAACLSAGEFNEVLSIGDKGPAWKDLPGTDGEMHSLADLKDKSVVVLIFTSASCEYAVDYEARIADFKRRFEDQSVAVVPVCVNKIPADSLDALTKRVKQKQLGFHYLYDESQKIAKDYGAIYTPEFYVLNKDRQVVYMGAFDDATDPAKVQNRWVEDAVKATLAGAMPEKTETVARGCLVRYARERRKPK
jgi:peroxiredoxin